MDWSAPLLENPRLMRKAVACALLITCGRMDQPTLASGQVSPDRYRQAEHLAMQGVGGTARYQDLPDKGQNLPDQGSGLLESACADKGTIRGLVVNGSRDRFAVSGIEVALRARLRGEFAIARVTTTDSRGRFQFENLPLDADIQYVPGASHGEVHYPGPRLRLTDENQNAQVQIVVYEPSMEPNPLVMEQHDIIVRPRPGVLEVTESMVIGNPSTMSFVGRPTQGSDRIGTLQLAIPSNFERVTFEKEFYGRRFLLVNGKLSTGIPWPPGRRRLKFTYVLPKDEGSIAWQRPVDLPCSLVRLTVLTDNPGEVRCNLEAQRSTTDTQVTFTTAGLILPAGEEIHLQMGPTAVPMMVYGRWAALTLLGVLICGTGVCLHRTRQAGRVGALIPRLCQEKQER